MSDTNTTITSAALQELHDLRALVAELKKKLNEHPDTLRLNWIEEQTRKSRSGVSFDYVRYVEEGYVIEKGFRVMRYMEIGDRADDIRTAIDSEIKRDKQLDNVT